MLKTNLLKLSKNIDTCSRTLNRNEKSWSKRHGKFVQNQTGQNNKDNNLCQESITAIIKRLTEHILDIAKRKEIHIPADITDVVEANNS